MDKVTVFTPTYNRGYLLKNAYQSLKNQTNKNFTWFIVDDGSTDQTETLVKHWMDEKHIKIKYVKQKNRGKHIAYNRVIDQVTTELFFCLDSDDCLTEDAVERILDLWHKEKNRQGIAGLIGPRGDFKDKKPKTRFPANVQYGKMAQLYDQYHYQGETIIVFKKSVYEKYQFPELKHEKFMTESVIYDQIDSKYELRYFDEVVYLSEYKEDGLSVQGMNLFIENPLGFAYFEKQRAGLHFQFKQRVFAACRYFAWCEKFELYDTFGLEIKWPEKILGYLLRPLYAKKIKKYLSDYKGKRS